MAEVLRLREAARVIGVSPGRLYRAIADGRLSAAPGSEPGKPTLVSLEALQAFYQSEGLRVPDTAEIPERSERLERAERSINADQNIEALAGHYLAQVMERQSHYVDLFLKEERTHLVERVVERVVDQVVERLGERLDAQRTGRDERSMERLIPAITDHKAAVLTRLRTLQAEGLSLQAIANQLNAEGIPTLSGKGRWQKGTIGNLLAQAEDIQGRADERTGCDGDAEGEKKE
jgi:Helix-turn-helix domain/Recombinase